MDEIKETREHLWGSITNKMDKIETESDRLKWDAVIDIIVDAFQDGATLDPLDLFLVLYQFTFRLYYRLKSMDNPEPFNQVSKTTRLENHKDIPYYQVKNYDYKMFKWALKRNYIQYLTNNWFLIPETDLLPSEKRKFEKQLTAKGE